MEQLTFWSGGLPARTSPSPEREPDFLESVADWPSTLSAWLVKSHRDGCFGKMFPDACPRTPGSTSVPLPRRWLTAGIILPTESWTLNSSEFPSVAVVSSLSDILETGDLPPRYFLSPKACAGILRRDGKRGMCSLVSREEGRLLTMTERRMYWKKQASE